MLRRAPAGEAGDSEIEATPEKVHRADLAHEAGTKLLHHAIRMHECLPEATSRSRVVVHMHTVFRKRNRFRNLNRTRQHRDADTNFKKRDQSGGVKISDRLGLEHNLPQLAACRADMKHVVDEIELHLQTLVACVHKRGREAPPRNVQRHLPPVVEHRLEGKPHLADDLRPYVQRVTGRLPRRHRQLGPARSDREPTHESRVARPPGGHRLMRFEISRSAGQDG